jgi:hypothetical protein
VACLELSQGFKEEYYFILFHWEMIMWVLYEECKSVKVEYPITRQSPSTTIRVVKDQTLLNPKPAKESIMG